MQKTGRKKIWVIANAVFEGLSAAVSLFLAFSILTSLPTGPLPDIDDPDQGGRLVVAGIGYFMAFFGLVASLFFIRSLRQLRDSR